MSRRVVTALTIAVLSACSQASHGAPPSGTASAEFIEQDADDPGSPPGPPRTKTTNPASCVDRDQFLETEPEWPEFAPTVDWFRDGCRVRVDVITEREARLLDCGVQAPHVVQVGQWNEARLSPRQQMTTYRRDGSNLLTEESQVSTVIPPGVVNTGYLSEHHQLWVDPTDTSTIYIVGDDSVERWAEGSDNICG